MSDEPDLVEATVTCHTRGCLNENIPIAILLTGTVICGPCGQVITDIET